MRHIKPSPRRTKARSITFDCGCVYRVNQQNRVTTINTEDCTTAKQQGCINAEIGEELVAETQA